MVLIKKKHRDNFTSSCKIEQVDIAITLWTCTPKVPGWSLGRDTGYPYRYSMAFLSLYRPIP